MRFDRDAAFALQIHRIEQLVLFIRSAIVPVLSSKRSDSVVLPWSMCAMMQKLRVRSMDIGKGGEYPRPKRPGQHCKLKDSNNSGSPGS